MERIVVPASDHQGSPQPVLPPQQPPQMPYTPQRTTQSPMMAPPGSAVVSPQEPQQAPQPQQAPPPQQPDNQPSAAEVMQWSYRALQAVSQSLQHLHTSLRESVQLLSSLSERVGAIEQQLDTQRQASPDLPPQPQPQLQPPSPQVLRPVMQQLPPQAAASSQPFDYQQLSEQLGL